MTARFAAAACACLSGRQACVCAAVVFGLLLSLPGARAAPGERLGSVAVAIDAQPEGNSGRLVGGVEGCVRAEIGQALDVDVVVLPPGIPADGLAGYEFKLFYDPRVLRVEREEPMLLGEAPGSSVVPISDPLPNSTGEHFSVAVDFGRPGVEPDGAAETGAGVLSRLTLVPENAGASTLVLRQVSLYDDRSRAIPAETGGAATVSVGANCALPTAAPTAAPAGPAAPGAAQDAPAPASLSGGPSSSGGPAPLAAAPTAAAIGHTGGPPGAAGAGGLPLAAGGLAAIALGVGLLRSAVAAAPGQRPRRRP